MAGCDLHERNMLLMVAEGTEQPQRRSHANTPDGRAKMIQWLKQRAESTGAVRIVFAYEACHLGFGLHDELTDHGIECHVFAPTLMSKSQKQRKNKTDEKDAKRVLGYLRSHLLAGEPLPSIWIPDHATRDDRQLVRLRLEVAHQASAFKTRIRCHLKLNGVEKPKRVGKGWTDAYREWLKQLSQGQCAGLMPGAQQVLRSRLRQLEALEEEVRLLSEHVAELAQTPRYLEPVRELLRFKGVGLITAMVFLTELGDLSRFPNRRKLAAYLGVVPSTDETGEADDRKGHITHQGPARVRQVLCQASWVRSWCVPEEKAACERIMKGKPKRKKIALVAQMRRLGIRMWHRALAAQQRCGSFAQESPSAHTE